MIKTKFVKSENVVLRLVLVALIFFNACEDPEIKVLDEYKNNACVFETADAIWKEVEDFGTVAAYYDPTRGAYNENGEENDPLSSDAFEDMCASFGLLPDIIKGHISFDREDICDEAELSSEVQFSLDSLRDTDPFTTVYTLCPKLIKDFYETTVVPSQGLKEEIDKAYGGPVEFLNAISSSNIAIAVTALTTYIELSKAFGKDEVMTYVLGGNSFSTDIVDFGNGCEASDEIYRKGQLIISKSWPDNNLRSVGANAEDWYKINCVDYQRLKTKVEGTITVTNKTSQQEDVTEQKVTLLGGKLTFSDGRLYEINQKLDRIRTVKAIPNPEAFGPFFTTELLINGIGWGSLTLDVENDDGEMLSVTPIINIKLEDIKYDETCDNGESLQLPISGVKTYTLTYRDAKDDLKLEKLVINYDDQSTSDPCNRIVRIQENDGSWKLFDMPDCEQL